MGGGGGTKWATYCMEHTHIGPPGTYMCQDRGRGTRPAQPPLHTGCGCCIYRGGEEKKTSVELTPQMHASIVHKQPREPAQSLSLKRSAVRYTSTEIPAAFTPSPSAFKDPSGWYGSRQHALTPAAEITQMESLSSLVWESGSRWPLKRCCARMRLLRRAQWADGFKSILPPDYR